MLLTVPHSGRFGIFLVTSLQLFPPSRVICTSPSLVPAQITPASFGPHLDAARLSIALAETRHRSPDAPGPRAAGPNDVVVHRIRCRETAFAPCDRMPHTARDLSSTASTAPKARELQAIARPAVRWTVLLVAVNEIRNLIVHGYVIDLCYRQLNVVPRVAPIHRDAHASVIHYRHAISVRRIDPHFMVVPSRARGHVGQRVATIDRS